MHWKRCILPCRLSLRTLLPSLNFGPQTPFFLYFPVLNGHHWEQADRVELLLEAITIITEVATGPGKLMGHLKYSQINGIHFYKRFICKMVKVKMVKNKTEHWQS